MPERSQPGNNYPHFSVHRLRQRAAQGLGEQGSDQAEVDRLFVTSPEGGRPDPHIIDADDVTRGLGLDHDLSLRISQVVRDTRADYSTKSAQQRIIAARGRLIAVMRAMVPHVPSDARQEVMRRAISYWKAQAPIDLGRTPQMRFGVSKSEAGVQKSLVAAIPLSKAMNAGWGTGPSGSGGPGSRTDSLPDFSIYLSPEYQGRREQELLAAENRRDAERDRARRMWGPREREGGNPELRYERQGWEARYAERTKPMLGIRMPTARGAKVKR